MDLERMFQEIDLKIKTLEETNVRLTNENKKLNKELDDLAGYKIDKYSLNKVKKSSDLIKEIEKRYNSTGMKVTCCRVNSYDKNTFKICGRCKLYNKWDNRTKCSSSSNK